MYREALIDYTHAISINPNYVEAYINRGQAKYLLKDYQGAIEDYDKVLKLLPDLESYDFFKWRGEAYQMKGDTANARLEFMKSDSFKSTTNKVKMYNKQSGY